MPDERTIPWGRVATGVGVAIGIATAGVTSYNASREYAEPLIASKPTFTFMERLALEGRIARLESQTERLDQTFSGDRIEMSAGARKRFGEDEAAADALRGRVAELEARVNELERRGRGN